MDGVLCISSWFDELVMFSMKMFPKKWSVANNVSTIEPKVEAKEITIMILGSTE